MDSKHAPPTHILLRRPPLFPSPALSLSRDATKVKVRNPNREDLRCVVHDRVWVYHDILLVGYSGLGISRPTALLLYVVVDSSVCA